MTLAPPVDRLVFTADPANQIDLLTTNSKLTSYEGSAEEP